MTMMWDRKKAMQTIMARRREGDGSMASLTPMKNEIVKDEDGEIDGRHLAAQDMIVALNEKSGEKLAKALQNFMDLHLNSEEEPEPEE